jgi:hypothetical protein
VYPGGCVCDGFRNKKARWPTEDKKTDLKKSLNSVLSLSNYKNTSANAYLDFDIVLMNTQRVNVF